MVDETRGVFPVNSMFNASSNAFGFSKCLLALVFVFLSIGSVGVHFNFANPVWADIGVNPKSLETSIRSFPKKHCPTEVRQVCTALSQGVLWFTGFDDKTP